MNAAAQTEKARRNLDELVTRLDVEKQLRLPKQYRLLGVNDLHDLPPMQWRVHSVLPTVGCASLYGASGCGKSFLSLDLIAAVATGESWFGYRVRPCRVVVVVLEGQPGFLRRVEAWEREHERAFPDNVLFLFEPFRLTSPEDVIALAAAIHDTGGADLILIDTLNRAAPEVDENSSRDIGLILEGVRELQSMVGGLVVLVSHTGKDSAKGLRGHSSLFAALDAAIEVCRSDDHREWKVAKSKDGEDGKTHPFRLRVVDLGEDDDGEPITSCIVEPKDDSDGAAAPRVRLPRARLPKGGNQRIVYDALGPLFRESTAFGKAGAPAIRPCLELDAAIAGCRDRLPVEGKRRTERARQAISGLTASGVLGCNEAWIWLV